MGYSGASSSPEGAARFRGEGIVHYHTANEEATYLLDGAGTLGMGGESVETEAGDSVALPVGESGARQVINDTDEHIRYLRVSTMHEPG